MANSITLYIGYDAQTLGKDDFDGEVVYDYYGRPVPKPAGGSLSLGTHSNSSKLIVESFVSLFERIANPKYLVRRVNVCANNTIPESRREPSLFDGMEAEALGIKPGQEESLQSARLKIIGKFGKNAILKGTNLQEGATTRDRNEQIGGHKA